MSTIRSILSASDFSSDATIAAQRAALLAREHGASLQLLNIVESDLLRQVRERVRGSDDVKQIFLEDARNRLDALADDLRRTFSATPACSVQIGNVLEEILAAADHADVLVLGTHGMRPVRDLLIGTTAERLLRRSRRPMLVCKQPPTTTYRRVLVAVDFSIHSIATLRFAHQIAPAAEFLVFHAYESPQETLLRHAVMPEQIIRQFDAHYGEQALSNMKNLCEKSGLTAARTAFAAECGDVKTFISAKAADWGADLIVLGKHGHSAVGELLVGGVTRHTVARARCDVAVVPDWPRL